MDILDNFQQTGQTYKQPNPYNYIATTGARFGNFIIDRLFLGFTFVLIIFTGIAIVQPQDMDPEAPPNGLIIGIVLFYLGLPIIIFLYYTLFEFYLGKTIGKMITGTRVVKDNGEKLSFGDAALRTICRIIPFEPFSILFSDKSVCWHDSSTKTLVVNDRFFYDSQG